MVTLNLKCPSCKNDIGVPDDIDFITCSNCGESLVVRKGKGYIALRLPENLETQDNITGKESQTYNLPPQKTASKGNLQFIVVLVIVIALLGAVCVCGGSMTTLLSSPTSASGSPTQISQNDAVVTPKSSDTPTITLTPTSLSPKGDLRVLSNTALMTGSGNGYSSKKDIKTGEVYSVYGKDKTGNWLLVSSEFDSWVIVASVELSVDLDKIPVVSEMYYPATSTPTPTPQAQGIVIGNSVNLRGGPGINYSVVGGAKKDEMLPIYGKNDDGSWVKVAQDQEIWISSSLVEIVGDMQKVKIAPTITPTSTSSTTPTPNMTKTTLYRGTANAKATLDALIDKPPVGTWCSEKDNTQVCVGDFRYITTIGYTRAPSNGRFIAFTVAVFNETSSDITASPFDFTLVMSDRRSFEYTSETYSYWATPFETVTIAPSDNAQGGLVFLVPNTVRPERLIYRSFWGDSIVIDLTLPPNR